MVFSREKQHAATIPGARQLCQVSHVEAKVHDVGRSRARKILREETFGRPLFRFKTDDEVIELANRTEYGLASRAK